MQQLSFVRRDYRLRSLDLTDDLAVNQDVGEIEANRTQVVGHGDLGLAKGRYSLLRKFDKHGGFVDLLEEARTQLTMNGKRRADDLLSQRAVEKRITCRLTRANNPRLIRANPRLKIAYSSQRAASFAWYVMMTSAPARAIAVSTSSVTDRSSR